MLLCSINQQKLNVLHKNQSRPIKANQCKTVTSGVVTVVTTSHNRRHTNVTTKRHYVRVVVVKIDLKLILEQRRK